MRRYLFASLVYLGIAIVCVAGCNQATSSPKGSAQVSDKASTNNVGGGDQTNTNQTKPSEEGQGDILRERSGFKTRVSTNPNYEADGKVDQPPAKLFSVVQYPSAVGPLVAYLSPDPKDGKKHPALIYAHGGFGGINGIQFGKEEFAPFRDAGYAIFIPSWRGENENAGKYEMFYGEVDDALAAIDYVTKLSYVDTSRIYMLGHSTGGTVTLLTAEANPRLRAAFSFGGAPDLTRVDYGNTPFDRRIEKEITLRSPINFIRTLKVPTYYFEGNRSPNGKADEGYLPDARRMQALADRAKTPLKVYTVDGGTHFNIVGPLCTLLVNKLKADTGDQCTVSITADEVNKAFAASKRGK